MTAHLCAPVPELASEVEHQRLRCCCDAPWVELLDRTTERTCHSNAESAMCALIDADARR